MTTANEGTYSCPVCKRDTPHNHGDIVQITDTDKLLRALADAGQRFNLALIGSGWWAGLSREGFISRHDRTLSVSGHGTAHQALRALAILVDRDDQIQDGDRWKLKTSSIHETQGGTSSNG